MRGYRAKLTAMAVLFVAVFFFFPFGGGDEEISTSNVQTIQENPTSDSDGAGVANPNKPSDGDVNGPNDREQFASTNLELILNSSSRNTNHDSSPYLQIRSDSLPQDRLLVSHMDYYVEHRSSTGGFLEGLDNAGQFRVKCEFSHFAYDDPIVFPGEPGRSHLHMFFGNTHSNADSTYDTLVNSGGSTCNGGELNRTSYWIPAVFDSKGNARVADTLLVYYKAYMPAVGSTVEYPEGMALISGDAMASTAQPGTKNNRELFFRCFEPGTDASDKSVNPRSDRLIDCSANQYLEMNIKFQTCWNGQDPADFKQNASYSNEWPTSGKCPDSHPMRLPQMEYRVFFESHDSNTSNWFLSSDVDMNDPTKLRTTPGYSIHGDWWGGWNRDIISQWIKNCTNVRKADCDQALLGDPRMQSNPKALVRRKEYTGPKVVPGKVLLEELCAANKSYVNIYSASFCMNHTT